MAAVSGRDLASLCFELAGYGEAKMRDQREAAPLLRSRGAARNFASPSSTARSR